jgi:hypothetical protein
MSSVFYYFGFLFFEGAIMLTFVATKNAILNLRLKPEVRDQFAIVAELRGASMSGLLHQFIVRSIREEKELAPQSFKSERKAPTILNGAELAPHSKRKIPMKIEPEGRKIKKAG